MLAKINFKFDLIQYRLFLSDINVANSHNFADDKARYREVWIVTCVRFIDHGCCRNVVFECKWKVCAHMYQSMVFIHSFQMDTGSAFINTSRNANSNRSKFFCACVRSRTFSDNDSCHFVLCILKIHLSVSGNVVTRNVVICVNFADGFVVQTATRILWH